MYAAGRGLLHVRGNWHGSPAIDGVVRQLASQGGTADFCTSVPLTVMGVFRDSFVAAMGEATS